MNGTLFFAWKIGKLWSRQAGCFQAELGKLHVSRRRVPFCLALACHLWPRHQLTMSQRAHVGPGDEAGARDEPFRLDEATIEELHAAIQAGRTTCVAVVQHCIERVRAYNGVASLLVTEDGAPVPEATGAVRATEPLRFPT